MREEKKERGLHDFGNAVFSDGKEMLKLRQLGLDKEGLGRV